MISLKNVSKKFSTAEGEFQAVSSVSLEINKGEVFGIIGFSGAGKSTLLRMINLLERPDTGSVFVDGVDLTNLTKKDLLKQRLSMGMIFQHFNLLSNRTVSENVSFSLEIAGIPKTERKKRVKECLEIVGLADKANTYPAKLSGGQKQRVAIARALATQPSVLLCDEPTSALDPQTTEGILKFLKEINENLGITIIIVTHEMEVIKSICHKVSVMEDGRVVETINLADLQFKPKSNIAQFLFKKELELQKEEGIVNVR